MITSTKITTLILFALLFGNLSAQEDSFKEDPVAELEDEDRTIRFGLQFSPNLSWFKANTEGYDNQGIKFGFSYGLAVDYFLSKNYLLSSGINITASGGELKFQGTTFENNTIPATVNASYRIGHIEIPTLLKLRTNEIGYLTYFGQFGFKTGFNHRASANFEYDFPANALINPEDVSASVNNSKRDINFINLYLVLGLGVEYNISGNTSVVLGLTFNNGFINQLDTKVNVLDANGNALIDGDGNPVLSEEDASANLNYFSLNVGVFF